MAEAEIGFHDTSRLVYVHTATATVPRSGLGGRALNVNGSVRCPVSECSRISAQIEMRMKDLKLEHEAPGVREKGKTEAPHTNW